MSYVAEIIRQDNSLGTTISLVQWPNTCTLAFIPGLEHSGTSVHNLTESRLQE